jgi:nucleotide-binding universal stress UspA family protein
MNAAGPGRILVPLDGSELAERALAPATALARRAGAGVELVHVHVPIPVEPIYVEGLPVIDDQWRSLRRDHERAYLEQVRERLGPDVAATATLLEGFAAPALAAHARASEAWLIALTSHGRGGLTRLWLGSVTDELARTSPVPLLVLRPEPAAAPAAFRRILVPLDGSARSEAALPHAERLARLAAEAEIVLLEVVQPIGAAFWLPTAGGEPTESLRAADLLRRQQEAARERLERVAASLAAAGLRVRTRVDTAEQVAAAILEAANAERADLVALATHGRSALARAALGSVADKVVRGSSTPVLVFRPAGP